LNSVASDHAKSVVTEPSDQEAASRADLMAGHIYFLGIAGVGVSALAQLALARGVRVSGADPHAVPEQNPAVARLSAGGAALYREHRETNLAPDVDLVVASAAVPASNPEMRVARQRGLRVVSRAEFLGELMAAHRGPRIAVAGTHGKTTTTAMIGVILQHCGWDPTVFVGAEVAQLGGNLRIGHESTPMVVEACEAYDSFLSLHPDIAVITNIEADHLDHYGAYEGVLNGFVRFARNVTPGKGVYCVCADDRGVHDILPQIERHAQVAAYVIDGRGHEEGATSIALNIEFGAVTAFRWRSMLTGKEIGISLQTPGLHNVYNALAAAGVCAGLGVGAEQIAAGLAGFRGAERRQEILGEIAFGDGTVLVMDDYAHHPTELIATIDALRSAYPERRLIAVFQPHLYSRTRDFLPQFAAALSNADLVVITDIYAAREQPLPGVSAKRIYDRFGSEPQRTHARYVPDMRQIPTLLAGELRAGDLVVFMGAGDIRESGEALVTMLRTQEARG
jgi:UDP-N-acetylmuramate--alanine ligase